MGFLPPGIYIALQPGGLLPGVPNRTPSRCPICAESGGFHDPAVHAENRCLIARRARLDELTRVTEELGLYEEVGDMQDRR